MKDSAKAERREVGPIAADFTIDQNWAAYTPDEHARWDALAARMGELIPGRADPAFLAAVDRLDLATNGVPDLERLSDVLESLTGWRVVPVSGLVPDEVFFDHLANRRFPAGAFLRAAHEFDYIEEPDIFHDVFGHVPLLANQAYADFMVAYGKGGAKAITMDALPMLARLYWYTIEFGLIQTTDGLRIFGAGILSSPTETKFALEDKSPNRIAFNLRRVMQTRYRIDDFQQTYFVIESFEQLLEDTAPDFSELYAGMASDPAYAPETVLEQDGVIDFGSQAYFSAKA